MKIITAPMEKKISIGLWCSLLALGGCQQPTEGELFFIPETDTLQEMPEKILPRPLIIEKELLYDNYTLQDSYPYKDTSRIFQWNRIEEYLTLIDSLNRQEEKWGILQNRRNINGTAPLVNEPSTNNYKRTTDQYGVERNQGIPLYINENTAIPERYGRDGEPVIIRTHNIDSVDNIEVGTVNYSGDWLVPRQYISFIDSTVFRKVIFVDRTNQNITSIEKIEDKWLVRSMNPATTGVKRPPYSQETPLGIFVIQEKKQRMIYLVDGSSDYGGFAPFASRFTNGAYIHGVPVNAPGQSVIEYSRTLGTTPRSHMCVRNASSHAQFIYDWAPVNESLVVVIE